MKSYVRDSISTEKNRKKLKKDQRMKAIFLLAALLSSSAIAIIIIFISVKGIFERLFLWAAGYCLLSDRNDVA